MQEATKTTTTPNPARRALFGASAAILLLAAPAAGDAKARELDGELLDLCARYQALEAKYRRLSEAEDGDTPTHLEAKAALAAMMDDYRDTMEAIADLPARTPEALQAKAAAIVAYHGNDYGLNYPHQRLEWSLIQDVAGRA